MKGKAEIRKMMLHARSSLSGPRRKRAEAEIAERLLSRPEWGRARVVALYYPVRGEVDLLSLLVDGGDAKVFLFPKVEKRGLQFMRVGSEKDLSPGAYGIPEPAGHCESWPLEDVDLFVVPGVAYSEMGERLGYGGGYYDRVLKEKGVWQLSVGVAFSCQVLPELPVEPWDRRVDLVLTEDRAIFSATAIPVGWVNRE